MAYGALIKTFIKKAKKKKEKKTLANYLKSKEIQDKLNPAGQQYLKDRVDSGATFGDAAKELLDVNELFGIDDFKDRMKKLEERGKKLMDFTGLSKKDLDEDKSGTIDPGEHYKATRKATILQKEEEAGATVRGKKKAEKMSGIGTMIKGFGVFFDEAMEIRKKLQEKHPNINKKGITASGQAKYIDLTKEAFRSEPELQSYLEHMEAASLELAVDIQGSRPTEDDRIVIRNIFPNPVSGPSEKDIYGARFLAKRMEARMGDSPDPKQLTALHEFRKMIDQQEQSFKTSTEAATVDYSNLWRGK